MCMFTIDDDMSGGISSVAVDLTSKLQHLLYLLLAGLNLIETVT